MATRINLLPWREWERERRRQEFLTNVVAVVVVAVIGVWAIGMYIDGRIENQQRRNAYLQQQIAEKNKRIREIRDLRAKREQLLARMQAIQELQGNRPVPVRVFDELVRTLADGVFYTKLELSGNVITVSGTAESNNRISALMRNIEASPWFKEPNLKGIKENRAYGPQASNFELTFVRTEPQAETEEG